MYKYFKQINNDYISQWKSKELSNEIITTPSAPNNFVNPSLEYLGVKLKVRFSGSCLKQNAVTYNHGKSVNIYIAYEITKNAGIDKYKYSSYGFGFDRRSSFSFGQNVLSFGVDKSFSAHIDNKKKTY